MFDNILFLPTFFSLIEAKLLDDCSYLGTEVTLNQLCPNTRQINGFYVDKKEEQKVRLLNAIKFAYAAIK